MAEYWPVTLKLNQAGVATETTLEAIRALANGETGLHALAADRAMFGELAVGSRVNEIEVNYFEDVPAHAASVTLANGGSTTVHEGHLHVVTGTNPAGSVVVASRDIIHYRAGHEVCALFTVAWTAGVANSYQRIGLFDTANGFWIGWEGATFVVSHRRLGVDTLHPRASWSEDTLQGAAGSLYTRAGVPEALDPATINVFRIRFGWLGSAPIYFEVLSPDGTWVTFHAIRQPNLSPETSVPTPNLPMRAEAANSGNTSSLILRTNCWAGSLHTNGFEPGIDKDNSSQTPLGANATFTGGWRNTEPYAAVAVSVLTDQVSATNGVAVDFSDNGVDTIRSEFFQVATASVGRTFILPMPTKFYRVRYTNGGTAQGMLNLQAKLSVTQYQNPEARIAATINDNTLALIARAVLGGKAAADGAYYNVPVSQTTGHLKVDVAESTGEVNIKSLRTLAINQANVTTAAAAIITPTANRRSISVKALASNNSKVYIGTSAGVTTGNGYELNSSESVDFEIDETVTIYAISLAGTQRICWAEVIK